MGTGFGMVGLASLIDSTLKAESSTTARRTAKPGARTGPLAPKPGHFPARAKQVIFLLMNGGISQIDTFDRKPLLDRLHGKPTHILPEQIPGSNIGIAGTLKRCPWDFKRYGQNGVEVSDLFPHVGEIIDDICIVRSTYTDLPNHEPALMMMNVGHNQQSRPSLGSWLTYGLGTENQNLPGFVVLCPGKPLMGPPLWNSSFLPSVYQGTHIPNHQRDPLKLIPNMRNDRFSRNEQRQLLDCLEEINRAHLDRQNEAADELETTIQTMEMAYRMQAEAPEAFDISQESEATRERYGDGDFGRGCLMALRLVERGVRVVQVYFDEGNPWDHHQDIIGHQFLAKRADQPIASLIKDLKDRGLLDETLVVIGTEFGRTPVMQAGGAISNGRDHNPHGFTTLLAGGGVKPGYIHGATDEIGFYAVQDKVHVHDLHATILHLMGLDHMKLTYHFSGRDFRLTDVHGRVVQEIII
jgi:hypothetical protein